MSQFSNVKNNPQILEFIKQTDIALKALGYTEHGLKHSSLVSDRALSIAKELGLSKKNQELSAISSFCHDMGNFLSRKYHNHLSAILFHQVFANDFSPNDLSIVMQAISFHDRSEMVLSHPVSAVTIIADKSDVRRSRVTERKMQKIRSDIHDRVNYATKKSRLKINKGKKNITLILKIDTNFVPVIEYFEIFTNRMVYCRRAANFLNYKFGLIINNFKLL